MVCQRVDHGTGSSTYEKLLRSSPIGPWVKLSERTFKYRGIVPVIVGTGCEGGRQDENGLEQHGRVKK